MSEVEQKRTIHVFIRDRIAVAMNEEPYICGNSDYVVLFDFDEEWDAHEVKTARFAYEETHQDVVFSGSECPVPKILDTKRIEIGVFAGDLRTTTGTYIGARRSILSKDGSPDEPKPDVYAQIMEKLNEIAQSGVTGDQIKAALAEYLEKNPIDGVSDEMLNRAVKAALDDAKESGDFKGDKGDTGERGTGILRVTSSFTSYGTTQDGSVMKRMLVSTIKSESGASDVKAGDVILTGSVLWKLTRVDSQYAYSTSAFSTSIKGDRGNTGATGAGGKDGSDGVSPTVTVMTITGGHRVTITDANGAKSFDVMDGEDGRDGSNAEGGAGAGIDDATPSTTTTYSSVKIDELLNEQKEAIVDEVHVGETEPTDPNVKVWINPEGEATNPGGGSNIDDNTSSPTTTYSSSKIDALLSEQKEAIDEELDSLNEEIAALKGGSEPTMSPNLCNPETMSVGFIQPGGYYNPDSTSYQCTDYISVTPGDTLHFTTSGDGYKDGVRFVCAYDANKVVQKDKGASHDESMLSYLVPDGVAYVRLTFYAGVTNIMVNTGDAPLPYVPYGPIGGADDETVSDNILSGKKWVVCGDSFTNGGYVSDDGFAEEVYRYQDGRYAGENITYPFIIAERNNMKIVKFFAGGRTLANPADGSFTNSITNPSGGCYYQNIPEDADYITIYLGINDSHHEAGSTGDDGEDTTGVIPLGTADDTDASTFCGAWNVVLPWLMTNRPNAHIGIIVSNGVDRVEYRTATIAAAKKWGIPYLDMNGDERCPAMIRTVNPDISSEAKNILKQKWGVTESNLHPNTAAQYFQSTFIENWLRSL